MKYYVSNNDLPGPKFRPPQRTSFHRPQHLQIVREAIGDVDVANGIRVEEPPQIGKVSLLKQKHSGIGGERLNYVAKDEWDCRRSDGERIGWSEHKLHPLSVRETVKGRDAVGLPNWVRLQKQILKFHSYYMEDVVSEAVEKKRLRKCQIYYFLEDDSMMVVEPPVPNSGMNQGTLVRRHRVPFQVLPEEDMAPDELPRPPPRIAKENYITYWDLNRSTDLMIYGHRHRIFDCDKFTQDFLLAQGIQVNPQEPEPVDNYSQYRAKMEAVEPKRPYKRPMTPRQFEPGQGKVLRFYGKWVDEQGALTEVRKLVVRFHLEDETVEVGEIHDVNSGRYKAPLFLKRCRLPKSIDKLVTLPGMSSEHTLLNVVRSQGPGKSIDAILIDNLETKTGSVIATCGENSDPSSFYGEDDFDIGRTVSITGRDVLLYDCDGFTRDYFKKVHGKVLEPLNLREEVKKKHEKEVFPFTGFGTEEDSLTSCQGLEPRPPQRDFFKFMNKDRDGFDSHILRFIARLVIDGKVDVKRKFVIAYFLSDDQILVTQVPEQNSGRTEGRFMKKAKMRKPAELQSPDLRLDSLYYTPQDLYVGAIVEFNKHSFLLTSADEYVFSYMERPSEVESFPQSNLRVIIEEVIKCVADKGGVKPMMADFLGQDPDDSGYVQEPVFRQILHSYVGYNLSEHQIIAIIRRFRSTERQFPDLPEDKLYSMLQAELKRINFLFFDQLYMSLRDKDLTSKGTLPKDVIRINLVSGFRASKSTLKSHYVNHIVEMLMKSIPDEELDYKQVVFKCNWMANPARPVAPEIVKSNFDNGPQQRQFVPVNYREFIEHLERKMDPGVQKYIATAEDFEKDRGRS